MNETVVSVAEEVAPKLSEKAVKAIYFVTGAVVGVVGKIGFDKLRAKKEAAYIETASNETSDEDFEEA